MIIIEKCFKLSDTSFTVLMCETECISKVKANAHMAVKFNRIVILNNKNI